MTVNSSHSEEDSDLVDLLQDDGKGTTSNTSTSSKQKYKYAKYYNHEISSPSSPNGCNLICRIPEILCFFCTSTLLNNPVLGKIGITSLIALLLYALVNLNIFGSTQEIGVIKYDFTQIHSQYDFDIGKVDHWCVAGGNRCSCPDPLDPTPRLHKAWFNAVERHKTMIADHKNVDVVFLGQTITETMNGRINGHDMSNSEYFGKVKHAFETSFSGPEDDSSVKAIAMGSTGDSASNVLWRLMNGELPDDFNPPIWWLVIGMEDIGRYGCSEEITIMGILRIVEEIKTKRPDAKIVVNSLLPMTKMRMKKADDEEEFVDAERANGKGPKPKAGHQHRKRTGAGADEHKDRMLKEDEPKNWDKGKKQNKAAKGNWDKGTKQTKAAKGEKKKEEHKNEKMKKNYEKAIKKDKYNPQLKDVKQFKKKRNHPEKIPMWSAIHQINLELHSFCKRTPHVTFFDSTSIFAAQGDDGDHVLLTEFISPRGHPTVRGFKTWLAAAKKQAEEWKKKMDHADAYHADDKSNWYLNDADYYQELDKEEAEWYAKEKARHRHEEHEGNDGEVITTVDADKNGEE